VKDRGDLNILALQVQAGLVVVVKRYYGKVAMVQLCVNKDDQVRILMLMLPSYLQS